MNQALIVLIVCATSGSAASARDQAATQGDRSASPRSKIYKLEELTWPQVDALDRERTLFILPVGMIEEHGPHLPVGADTFGVTYEANGASRRVSRALPDWSVVMMPQSTTVRAERTSWATCWSIQGRTAFGSRRCDHLWPILADRSRRTASNGFSS